MNEIVKCWRALQKTDSTAANKMLHEILAFHSFFVRSVEGRKKLESNCDLNGMCIFFCAVFPLCHADAQCVNLQQDVFISTQKSSRGTPRHSHDMTWHGISIAMA